MTTPDRVPPARVQKADGHHLVTHSGWQISVAPDGLLMLPRHLHPDEVEDFVRCALVAKDIGSGVIKENEQRPPGGPGLSARQAIVTQGAPPSGATRMRTTSGPQRATIGRSQRRGSR